MYTFFQVNMIEESKENCDFCSMNVAENPLDLQSEEEDSLFTGNFFLSTDFLAQISLQTLLTISKMGMIN